MTPQPSARAAVCLAPARLDHALVAAGLFESRAKAQEAIGAGLVRVGDRAIDKASAKVRAGDALQAEPLYPWVSRGGVKLAAALDQFGIDPSGRLCLDVGASTGGFTDVLLSHGAAVVFAVDTGREQLHSRIGTDPRVHDWSGTDARDLTPDRFATAPSLIVCDASFISLALILPAVLPLATPGGMLVALIKPQFEVGPAGVRKGLVRDQALRESACSKIQALVAAAGWTVLGLIPSPIAGGDGNMEYLIAARAP